MERKIQGETQIISSMDNTLWEITVLLCLFMSAVRAQDTSNQHAVDPLHPSMAVMLVVLSIMLCVTFLIVAYAKFCHERELHQLNQVEGLARINRSRTRFSGIDRRVVESLPFFRFSSLRGSKEGLECAVCLSGFEDTEILRLLPRCRHAFHMNCIDKWLENHSSCPLCRYRFDVGDLKILTDTNSFRYPRASIGEGDLEFYIERVESTRERSSSFNMVGKGKREEPLIGEFRIDRIRHKIIVSDVMYKSRWSDVNSSDLMSLNSQMLDVLSSERFSSAAAVGGRLGSDLPAKEHILRIKEVNTERKRLQEHGVSRGEHSSAATTSHCNDSDNELKHNTMSKWLDPSQKRSMSEITNVSRFKEYAATSRIHGSSIPANMEKDENVRRVWLPIARNTVRKFGS